VFSDDWMRVAAIPGQLFQRGRPYDWYGIGDEKGVLRLAVNLWLVDPFSKTDSVKLRPTLGLFLSNQPFGRPPVVRCMSQPSAGCQHSWYGMLGSKRCWPAWRLSLIVISLDDRKNDIDRQELISYQVIEFRLFEQACKINEGARNVTLWPPW
jgi:hypothetical protein